MSCVTCNTTVASVSILLVAAYEIRSFKSFKKASLQASSDLATFDWTEVARRKSKSSQASFHLKEALGASTTGVHDSLGNSLTVELGELLNKLIVLQKNRPCTRRRVGDRGRAPAPSDIYCSFQRRDL